jgi:hypothetical protein
MFCGTPADWPGIWHATGGIQNPNMVPVGLTVTIACTSAGGGYDPPAPRHARTASYASGGDPSDGHGGAFCKPDCWGDGDGDGFDLSHPPGQGGGGNPGYQSATRRVYSGARSHRSYSSSGSYGNSSPSNYSGFQACVIARESGGNSQVMNGSGHYGLYQFSSGTWQAYGGSASTFGHASVSEQNRVFGNAMAQGGQSNWSPYDGC